MDPAEDEDYIANQFCQPVPDINTADTAKFRTDKFGELDHNALSDDMEGVQEIGNCDSEPHPFGVNMGSDESEMLQRVDDNKIFDDDGEHCRYNPVDTRADDILN